MQEKFSYYDFIAVFVPGALLLWSISLFGAAAPKPVLLPSGNTVIDAVLFGVLAFALGHIVQYFAKRTIEVAIKKAFWRGRFFAELFLLRDSGCCSEATRAQYVRLAGDVFGFSAQQLALLENPQDSKTGSAHRVSQDVYRRFDSFTLDKQVAGKAHTQNTLYGFFRGLSLVCLISFLQFLTLFIQQRQWSDLAVCLVAALCAMAFAGRARQRGEFYVRGIFDSVAAYFARGGGQA